MYRALILMTVLALAACGQGDKAEPSPASPPPPPKDGTAPAPRELTEIGLRRVCAAGLASIHGQQPSAITVDGVRERIVTASWRAPVDGGARRAECRVDGDMIIWKPLDRPDEAQNRWMNQAGDPLVRFVATERRITVNTTLPDGTTATESYPVATDQEAA